MLAAHLSPVAPVILIARPRRLAAELSFRLRDEQGTRAITLPQCSPSTPGPAVKRLIVATKAQDALPAVESVAPSLADDCALLLMQNGMGSQEAIVARFPGLSIHAASSTEGAYREAPDTVVHAGRGITRIGLLNGATVDWVGLFRAAQLEAEPVERIEWHLANKLRINCLINPLTVVYDCRNGALLEDAHALDQMRKLGEQADAVLSAAGFTFTEPAFDAACTVARATAANRSSMLQDARAGRRTELDYMTGYLLRLAERYGFDADEHRALYRELMARFPRN